MNYRDEVLRTMNRTLTKDQQLANAALGLAGEAGEVAECIKKILFHGGTVDKTKILKELGDVRWYLELLCHELQTSIETVEATNINKLRSRYPYGFSREASVDRKDEK